MADIAELIGIPFAYGGRGPDKYDCYGLVMELMRRDGVIIPDYLSPEDGHKITALFAVELNKWSEIPGPKKGCAALIRVPGNTHVAYVLDDNKMIHTWAKSGGVVIERIDTWRPRIRGFYRYGI